MWINLGSRDREIIFDYIVESSGFAEVLTRGRQESQMHRLGHLTTEAEGEKLMRYWVRSEGRKTVLIL